MNKFLYLASSLLLIVLMSCSTETRNRENILVVSVEPQRAMLEQLAGDNFEIVTMLPPGSNPETFEPGMQTRKNLESATAFFITGYLPFEDKLIDALGENSGVRIVNTSEGITPLFGTHEHNHDHGHGHGHSHHHGEKEGADPHVWTSVPNARIMLANMQKELSEIDPENAPAYAQRLEAYDQHLDSLYKAHRAMLESPGAHKAFAIWHPSLSYLANDYGLEQIAVGFENKEMPAATLRRVIDEAREEGVTVLFFQKEFDSRQARTLNDALGTRMITINPLAYDWENQLDTIVSALCD